MCGDMLIIRGDIEEFPELPPMSRFGATVIKVIFPWHLGCSIEDILDAAWKKAPKKSILSLLFLEELS